MLLSAPNQFSNPSVKVQKRILFALTFTTLFLLIIISYLDSPLKTIEAPDGIVSFELAKSFENAQKIISSWNANAKSYAFKSLVVDYLFLVSYSLFFAFLIFKLSKSLLDKNFSRFARIGIVLGWLQFLAAISDALENYFLLRQLLGSQNQMFPQFAFYFALIKFTIIFLGIVYLITGAILNFIHKKHVVPE